MADNLKIDVVLADVGESGVALSNYVTKDVHGQDLGTKADLVGGKVKPEQLPAFNELTGVTEQFNGLENTLRSETDAALIEAKTYADNIVSNAMSSKAGLVGGRVPSSQATEFKDVPGAKGVIDGLKQSFQLGLNGLKNELETNYPKLVNGKISRLNIPNDILMYSDDLTQIRNDFQTGYAQFTADINQTKSELQSGYEAFIDGSDARYAAKEIEADVYELNLYGTKSYDMPTGGYPVDAVVRLDSGEIVKSTVANNTTNPNVDMTGWVKANDASQIIDASGKTQQEINDTSEKQVKIVTPYLFGAKGDRITDDTQALRDFWEYCAKNPVITADCSGDFLISGDIYADTGVQLWWKDKPNYAQNFTGHMTLRPNGYVSGNAVLHLKGFYSTDFMCKFSIMCPGSSGYSTRKNATGIIFEDCSRVEACHLEVWYASGRGVVARGKTSVFNFASIDCWYCGATAGASAANNIALSNPTYTHTGSSGGSGQRTEITVSENSIPTALQVNDFVMFFNSASKYSEVKQIRGIDRENNKITVFPWVYTSDEAYSPYYIIGGGFYADGGDTSAARIGRLSSVSCGVSCNSQSLYPISIFNHITQYCGIGFASGLGASEGGVTTNMYCEANGLNDLACSGNAKYTYISIGPEAEEWKFAHLQAAVLSGDQRIRNNLTSPRIYGKTGQLPLSSNGQLANGVTQFSPTISTGKATPISLFVNQSEGGGYRGATVYLDYNDVKNREFGLDTVWVLLHSSTPSGAMSGNAIFAPISGQSYTVNGSTTWSTQIYGPTLFCCRYINGDWRVFRFNGFVDSQRTVSVNFNPPSLANATQQSTDVVLNGAKLGDTIIVSFDKPLSGTRMWGEVTAANTVTVYHRNDTGATVDVASGILTVKMI